jgi:hypothetical protein
MLVIRHISFDSILNDREVCETISQTNIGAAHQSELHGSHLVSIAVTIKLDDELIF